MNRREHLQLGLIAGFGGAAVYIGNKLINDEDVALKDFGNALLFIVTAYIGSALPDILEPAKNPHHRKFFHSLTCSGALGGMSLKISNIKNESIKMALYGLGAGYATHLISDSTTPRSLPLI
ncbi:metal-dependent hydrolase [bacterium]|nr:metal-dependent hydrolase [bacterium]